MSQCYRSLSDLAGPVFGTWKKLRVYFYTRLKMYFLMISLAATSNASAMPKQNAPRPLNADFKPMNSTALRKRWVRNDNRHGDCVLLPRTWPKEWEHVFSDGFNQTTKPGTNVLVHQPVWLTGVWTLPPPNQHLTGAHFKPCIKDNRGCVSLALH